MVVERVSKWVQIDQIGHVYHLSFQHGPHKKGLEEKEKEREEEKTWIGELPNIGPQSPSLNHLHDNKAMGLGVPLT